MVRATSGLVVSLLVLLLVSVALAQLPTGTILGVVKDASGGVVPGAPVTARNVDTGQSRSAVTQADGSYRFNALPVGNYEVRVEAKGFQVAVRSGLTLTVAQEAVVNISLQVGAASQTVVVTTEAPLVNTTSGSLGGLVNEQKVADLPLNGRNYIDLALLQPGVNIDMNKPVGEATWYSSNGAGVRSNYYLMDGTPTRNLYGTNPSSQVATALGVDGVKEFRLITNNMSAEYGMSMGSVMTVVSKSGTNSFHGDAYEYLRNSALDARNFFDVPPSVLGRRLPSFTQNQFGASFGGPIQKDKTFFYATYESLHQRLGTSLRPTTLDPGCFGAAGATITNTACPQLGSTSSVKISAVIAPLLALYPPATSLSDHSFPFAFSSPLLDNFGQGRVDHTFSANDTMFIRFTTDHANQTYYSQVFPQFTDIPASHNDYATLGETHIFTASLLNTARFSWANTTLRTGGPTPFIGPQYSFVQGQPLGAINVSGLDQFGPDTPIPISERQYIWTWSDDVFYTRGRHSLKFGTLINRITQEPHGGTPGLRGSLTFPNVASFLQGLPAAEAALTPGGSFYRDYRNETYGFYVQDDWRTTSRLTLNLGLRYEFNTVPRELHGLESSIRNPYTGVTPIVGPLMVNNSLHNFSPRVGFAWDVFGNGKMAVRGGFSLLYDISNLGAGLITVPLGQPPFAFSSTDNSPGPLDAIPLDCPSQTSGLPLCFSPANAGKTLQMMDYNFQQPSMKQFNLTVERQLPWNMALTVAYGGSLGQHIVTSGHQGNPVVPGGVPDANGNCVARPAGQALNLTSMVDGSATACWLKGDPRVNPAWSSIAYRTADGSSWYNSLQVTLNKQLSKGLQFQSSYTWSKSIDELQNQLGTDQTFTEAASRTDAFHTTTDRGPSIFDSGQNWHFNALYHFPSPQASGFTGKMLGGWWLAGIETIQTGYPFTSCVSSNVSRSVIARGGCADRPDFVTSANLAAAQALDPNAVVYNASTVIIGNPQLWFNPHMFTAAHPGFLGDVGRNLLRGPGFSNLDFTVAKDTRLGFLGESGNLEFRAEFFNIMNHANFQFGNNGGGTGILVDASSAGVLKDAFPAREIQFALKLIF
jgi:Carboxypeptidase regulatory-like domain/TonB dependent receptor-like, beta-barrel